MATSKTSAKKASASKKANPGAVPVKHQGGSLRSLMDFNFQDMEKLFHDFFIRSPLRASAWSLPDFDELREKVNTRLPDIDVVERRKEVMVKAELPGCDKEDIELTIADGNINIAARHTEEKEETDANYLRHEISSREYQRTIPAPFGVDASKATADMKHGVLRIHFPKNGAKTKHRLSVS